MFLCVWQGGGGGGEDTLTLREGLSQFKFELTYCQVKDLVFKSRPNQCPGSYFLIEVEYELPLL